MADSVAGLWAEMMKLWRDDCRRTDYFAKRALPQSLSNAMAKTTMDGAHITAASRYGNFDEWGRADVIRP